MDKHELRKMTAGVVVAVLVLTAAWLVLPIGLPSFVLVALDTAVVMGPVLWLRMTRGPGRRLLAPWVVFLHPGRVEGVVERYDYGRSVTVGYEVHGVHFQVTEAVRREKRFRSTGIDLSGDVLISSGEACYHTTNLGDLRLHGPIGVRYRLGDPSDAVLVPNPHGPAARSQTR